MIDWHQKIRERVLCEIFNITLIYQLSRLLENFVFISLFLSPFYSNQHMFSGSVSIYEC